MIRSAFLALSLWSAGAGAAPLYDNRVLTVSYAPDRVIELETAIGNTLTVILDPGERIRSVTVGLPQAFDVRVSDLGDSLFVRPLGSAPSTTMSVDSDRRSYQFRLISTPSSGSVYAVRLDYGASAAAQQQVLSAPEGLTVPAGTYRVSGDKSLRPYSIRDDGQRTYIEWSAEQLLPAVFAIDAQGQEAMVDGYMRGGIFTIDRTFARLVFRIDKRKAEARRQTEKKP